MKSSATHPKNFHDGAKFYYCSFAVILFDKIIKKKKYDLAITCRDYKVLSNDTLLQKKKKREIEGGNHRNLVRLRFNFTFFQIWKGHSIP